MECGWERAGDGEGGSADVEDEGLAWGYEARGELADASFGIGVRFGSLRVGGFFAADRGGGHGAAVDAAELPLVVEADEVAADRFA